jgi:hypothetical protein
MLQVAKMIIVVAVAFIVAWTPFYAVTFVSQVQKDSFLKKKHFMFTMLSTHLVGFLNSCVNPFIYNCMSDKFRKSFRHILRNLCCRLCRGKKYIKAREEMSVLDSNSRRISPTPSMTDVREMDTRVSHMKPLSFRSSLLSNNKKNSGRKNHSSASYCNFPSLYKRGGANSGGGGDHGGGAGKISIKVNICDGQTVVSPASHNGLVNGGLLKSSNSAGLKRSSSPVDCTPGAAVGGAMGASHHHRDPSPHRDRRATGHAHSQDLDCQHNGSAEYVFCFPTSPDDSC